MLKGGAAAAAATLLGVGGAAPAVAATTQSRIGINATRVPTCYRTGYAAYGSGSISTYRGETAFTYNDTFYGLCNAWADTYGSILAWMTGGATRVWFFGCAGVTVNKPGNHGTGNAFDCTGVYHTSGDFVCGNYSHRSYAGVVHNRRYAGLAWAARKHVPEVGIVGTDSSHANHMHFGRYKNGSTSLLLSHYGRSWDAWLVQYSCKAFLGVPIALDGDWGPQTETYFQQLLARLGMSGRNPFGVTAHVQDLAHMLTAYGVVGAAL
jgi:hypothetical protein